MEEWIADLTLTVVLHESKGVCAVRVAVWVRRKRRKADMLFCNPIHYFYEGIGYWFTSRAAGRIGGIAASGSGRHSQHSNVMGATKVVYAPCTAYLQEIDFSQITGGMELFDRMIRAAYF
jgi:hypothetical protein